MKPADSVHLGKHSMLTSGHVCGVGHGACVQVVTTLADMEGNETFDPAMLGHAEQVAEARVGDGEMIYIQVCR